MRLRWTCQVDMEGYVMNNESKHSPVVECITIVTVLMEFVITLAEFVPVVVDLYNLAFNYSKIESVNVRIKLV